MSIISQLRPFFSAEYYACSFEYYIAYESSQEASPLNLCLTDTLKNDFEMTKLGDMWNVI